MIFAFLAVAREKSLRSFSRIRQEHIGNLKEKKNDGFPACIHPVRTAVQVPLTEDGPKDISFPAPHAAFTAMLRRMDATRRRGPCGKRRGGSVFSDEETASFFSGQSPDRRPFPRKKRFPFPGSYPPESGPAVNRLPRRQE